MSVRILDNFVRNKSPPAFHFVRISLLKEEVKTYAHQNTCSFSLYATGFSLLTHYISISINFKKF